MPIGTKPQAEVTIDLSLVRALIQEQHQGPGASGIERHRRGVGTTDCSGWAMILWCAYLGAPPSAALIEHEQRWLPRLSPRLHCPFQFRAVSASRLRVSLVVVHHRVVFRSDDAA